MRTYSLPLTRYHLVHKLQVLFPSFPFGEGGADVSRRHLPSGKEVKLPMPFVGAAISPYDFALRVSTQPVLRSRAWMLGFSSTPITKAFSGGFSYNPTMSAARGQTAG
jgi:hypothetical protein